MLKRFWIALLAMALLAMPAALAIAEANDAAPGAAQVDADAPGAAQADADAPGDAQADADAPGDAGDAGEEAPRPANGYVLVRMTTQAGWLPLPDEGEYSFPIKQTLQDGTEVENVLHLTPEGMYMEDSTCENHDCIGQGEVTLENRKDRILGNMIICLPNQLSLELYTPEEVVELLKEQAEAPDGADAP